MAKTINMKCFVDFWGNMYVSLVIWINTSFAKTDIQALCKPENVYVVTTIGNRTRINHSGIWMFACSVCLCIHMYTYMHVCTYALDMRVCACICCRFVHTTCICGASSNELSWLYTWVRCLKLIRFVIQLNFWLRHKGVHKFDRYVCMTASPYTRSTSWVDV